MYPHSYLHKFVSKYMLSYPAPICKQLFSPLANIFVDTYRIQVHFVIPVYSSEVNVKDFRKDSPRIF